MGPQPSGTSDRRGVRLRELHRSDVVGARSATPPLGCPTLICLPRLRDRPGPRTHGRHASSRHRRPGALTEVMAAAGRHGRPARRRPVVGPVWPGLNCPGRAVTQGGVRQKQHFQRGNLEAQVRICARGDVDHPLGQVDAVDIQASGVQMAADSARAGTASAMGLSWAVAQRVLTPGAWWLVACQMVTAGE